MVPPTLDTFAQKIAVQEKDLWTPIFLQAVVDILPGSTAAALLLVQDETVTVLGGVGEVPGFGENTLPALPYHEGDTLWLAFPGFPGGALWLRTTSGMEEASTRLTGWLAVAGMGLAKEQAAVEREQQRAARDHFFSMVNHDLKSPLSSIKAMSDLIGRKVKRGSLDLTTEEGREDLQRRLGLLSQRVKDMASLIDVIGDVSNIERGRLELNQRQANLDAIIESVVQEIRKETERDIQLDGPGQSLPISADVTRLVQVFQILLKNATDYSKPGTTVTVQLANRDDAACVEIRDQGRGIEPEHQARMFREYGRAVQQAPSGLGVGLYIAAALVDAHDGDMDLESEPGEGTVIRVHLPLAGQNRPVESSDGREISNYPIERAERAQG